MYIYIYIYVYVCVCMYMNMYMNMYMYAPDCGTVLRLKPSPSTSRKASPRRGAPRTTSCRPSTFDGRRND